jgi:predicted ATPase
VDAVVYTAEYLWYIMVSKEELEDILHDEEIKERYRSIDQEKLRKAEKKHQWYREYTKKEYHPQSYQIKKEIEEWEQNNPFFQEQWDDTTTMFILWSFYLTAYFIVGLVVVKAILF